jgi:hypothetical protein
MREIRGLKDASPAFRLAIATSWLAPDSGQENREEKIREAMEAGPDWTEYLSLVDRHQIPALSWAALSRVGGIKVPDFIRRELQKRSELCRIQGMRRALVLADVLKEFNRAAIPAMPLKGPVLSYELYGDVGLRASDDLDLQVRGEDLRRAMACLENTGWKPGSDFRTMSPRQWESFLRNDYEAQFTHPLLGCSLELHWRNHWETGEATDARWARSTSTVWQGRSIRSMSAGDLALFLCVHGAYHIWCCAKWLGDLARAHSIGRLDWRSAVDEARSLGLEGVCPTAQSLMQTLYGLEVPIPAGTPAGRAQERLSPLLLEMPLESLQLPEDPRGRMGMALLRNHTRMVRYERLVRPQKTWWESLSQLFYCRQDFQILSLPDRFFWAYKPLRPILWLWRWAAQTWRRLPAQKLIAKRGAPATLKPLRERARMQATAPPEQRLQQSAGIEVR